MGMSPGRHNAYFANKRKEDEERKQSNKKMGWWFAMEEQRAREQFNKDMRNVCKKCNTIRNYERECPFGCPQD